MTKKRSQPNVFIIESLREGEPRDGEILSQILRTSGKNPIYRTFNNTNELRNLVDEFEGSKYRYLHISCHGREDRIKFRDERIDFDTFSRIFEGKLKNRRLFISGCQLGNPNLIQAVFDKNLKLFSIIGPINQPSFFESIVFWSSFYYLLNTASQRLISSNRMKIVVKHLSELLESQMLLAWIDKDTKQITTESFAYPEFWAKYIDS